MPKAVEAAGLLARSPGMIAYNLAPERPSEHSISAGWHARPKTGRCSRTVLALPVGSPVPCKSLRASPGKEEES
jgi:hypothetical protein